MITRRAGSFIDFAAQHMRFVFLLGAFAILASTWPNGSVQAAASTAHYLRSGLVTVNKDGYQVRFSAINTYDTDQEITLSLSDANGKVLKSTTSIVGPDRSLTLAFDPPAPIRMRAALLVKADAGFLCDGFAPTLELDNTSTAGTKPVLVIDEFWHMDVPLE